MSYSIILQKLNNTNNSNDISDFNRNLTDRLGSPPTSATESTTQETPVEPPGVPSLSTLSGGEISKMQPIFLKWEAVRGKTETNQRKLRGVKKLY